MNEEKEKEKEFLEAIEEGWDYPGMDYTRKCPIMDFVLLYHESVEIVQLHHLYIGSLRKGNT